MRSAVNFVACLFRIDSPSASLSLTSANDRSKPSYLELQAKHDLLHRVLLLFGHISKGCYLSILSNMLPYRESENFSVTALLSARNSNLCAWYCLSDGLKLLAYMYVIYMQNC